MFIYDKYESQIDILINGPSVTNNLFFSDILFGLKLAWSLIYMGLAGQGVIVPPE